MSNIPKTISCLKKTTTMHIEPTYDYNAPVELTAVFRIPQPDGTMQEHNYRLAVLWENIKSISSYPYIDDWKTCAGPKYNLELTGSSDMVLILGSFDSMLKHWATFRQRFPIFVIQETDGLGKD